MFEPRWIGIGLCWLGLWLAIAAGLVLWGGLIGLLMGSVSYPAFQLLGKDYELAFLAQRGALLGAQYLGVWALGISLVACFVIGHRRLERSEANPSEKSPNAVAPGLPQR